MSYQPTKISQGSKLEFTRWLDDELRKISQAFDQVNNLALDPLAAEPARYREGDVIYADGTTYDPGFGAGPYYRSAATWIKMADTGGGAGVTSFNTRVGAVVPLVGDYSAFYAGLVHTHVEADITDLQPYLLDAPIDGSDYGRRDGAWEIIPGGSVSVTAPYRFQASLVEADPGNGNFRMDNATPASVTEIFVSSTTDDNNDFDNMLGFLGAGDRVYIQQDNDATKFILLDVTANVDNTGWYSIAGTIAASGTIFDTNGKCHIMFLFGSNPSSLPSGTVDGSLLRWDNGGAAYVEETNLVFNEQETGIPGGLTGNTLEIIDNVSGRAGLRLTVPGIEDLLLYVDDATFQANLQTQNLVVSAPSGTHFLHVARFGYISNNDNLSINHSVAGHEITSGLFAGDIDFLAQNGNSSVRLVFGTTLKIAESASALGDDPAFGQFWVRNDVPNTPMFTDDSGVDHVLNAAGGVTDHGALTGLADDDHTQYPLLLGRAGGQTLIGGTGAGDDLTLVGTSGALAGARVNMNSPVEFGPYEPTGAQYGFNYEATESFTGAFVGGGLNFSGTIDFTNSTFIYESFRGAPTITTGVNPGFAAYTVLQALPRFEAGAGAGHNPLSPLIVNAGPRVNNLNVGTRTAATISGMNFAPTVGAELAGAIMNATSITGLVVAPKWDTHAGATINLGTIRGVHIQNPAQGLFQSSAGVEAMTALIGVDVDAIGFGGNVTKRALRSNLAAATNALMIENTGTAESDFGAGDIHLDDNTYIKFGGTIAASDMWIGWQTTDSVLNFSTFAGVNGNPLQLRATAADEWIFQQNPSGTVDIGMAFNMNAIVFGTTLPTPNSNNWFCQFAAPNQRQVQLGGEYSDVLWTAGGSIDVNGQAVSNLQAFKINSPAVILNGGTISDISNLFVEAMPSFGATRTQALRVLGRARIDGRMNHGSEQPAQLTANVNDWQLAANNGQRAMAILTTDGSGPYNVTGIDSSFGRAQTGEIVTVYNASADTITFTHLDVLSLAANRLDMVGAAGVAVGPRESIKFWYDDQGSATWFHVQEQ